MVCIWLIVFFIGCRGQSANDSALAVETSSATEDTAASFCDGAPVVGWETFGSSFIGHECQPCHGSWSDDRFGAPKNVTFDSVDQVWSWKDRILSRATGDKPSMPPNGGTFEDDQMKLAWWLRCSAEGT